MWPLAYIALVALAYFGPNAEILASIKLRIWHNQTIIDDFVAYASTVGMLFVVDFLSFVINGMVIWNLCNVNLLKVMQKIQERYWSVMIFVEAVLLLEVGTTSILIMIC